MTTPEPGAPSRVIVVGASAGGVDALREFVGALPADLPACVCVVLHIPANAPSALAGILDRAGPLPAVTAEADQPVRPGTVVVARPDHHLLVGETLLALGRGPRENGHRPAVDVLFRTAARWWGPRVIAVVLSGSLDDGAAGAYTVAQCGGVVLVQDVESAAYTGMPSATLATVPQAAVGRPAELAKLAAEACRFPVTDPHPPIDRTLEIEAAMAELDEAAHAGHERPGVPAALACPDCGGAMFELESGPLLRYRCRVGHAWSPESLVTQQVESTEAALWTAVRTLEEEASLQRRLARRSSGVAGRKHAQRAEESDASAATIRHLLRAADRADRIS